MKCEWEATEHAGEATTALIVHTRRDIDVTAVLVVKATEGGGFYRSNL